MSADSTAPKVGQVWADNDKRSAGRKVRIISIDATHATVIDMRGKRDTRIRLDRFRPTSNGYRLVDDAPGGAR